MAQDWQAKLELNPNDYMRGMNRVEQRSRRAATYVSDKFRAAGRMLTSLPGLITGGLIAVWTRNTVKLAMEQEAAVEDLNAALRTHEHYTEAASRSLQDYASAMQQATTYGDEQILRMQAQLATFGMTEKQIKAATQTTLDFAAAQKIDLRTAALLVGKAYTGETSTLSRYGIVMGETAEGGRDFSAVLAKMNEMFAGRAAAAADTAAGRMQQLANAYGDVREQTGLVITNSSAFHGILRGLTDVFADLASGADKGAEKTAEWQGKVEKWRDRVAEAGAAGMMLWDTMWGGAEAFFGLAEIGFGAMVTALKNIETTGTATWASLVTVASGGLEDFIRAATGKTQSLGDLQAEALLSGTALGEAIDATRRKDPIDRALDAIRDFNKDYERQAADAWGELGEKLADSPWWRRGMENWEEGRDKQLKAYQDYVDRLMDIWDKREEEQKDQEDEAADFATAQVAQYEAITKAMEKEYSAREKLTQRHYDKIVSLQQDRARQAEEWEERVYGIKTEGLSEEGVRKQAEGMARTFYRRAYSAEQRGEYEESRRLLGKAVDYAEEADFKMRDLERAQRLIQRSYRLQEEQERQAAEANRDRMVELKERMAQLEKAAEIKIKFDDKEAREQIDDLAARMESLREPIPALAGAGAGVAVGQINVNVSEKLERGDIRKLIVDELKRLKNRGRY